MQQESSASRAMVVPLVVAALLTTIFLLAPVLPRPRTDLEFRVSAYASGIVFFLLIGQFVWSLVPARLMARSTLAAAIIVMIIAVLTLNVFEIPVASDIAKIGFGSLAGLAFVRAIERPWWFLPVCIFVPLADAWSVFSDRGVTNAVVNRAKEDRAWLDWPTIATPLPGYPYELFGRIGIVDILFLALFMGAASRFDLGRLRALVVLPLAFVLTNVIVYEGWNTVVPALPMICLAFLVVYGRPLWRDLRADLAHR